MGLISKCQHVCFMLLLFLMIQAHSQKVLNILHNGAVGDGSTDNNEILIDAWTQACNSGGYSVILIPEGTFFLSSAKFIGPCKGTIKFQVEGVLKASTDDSFFVGMDHWITFRYVRRLIITGGGTFDGQGDSGWKYNNCSVDPHCPALPISLRFDFVNTAWISNISLINSKNAHINVFACKYIIFDNVNVLSPESSPNTDGFHIAISKYVTVKDSVISTGDDCIAFGPGAKKVNITNVQCGPGHGISIGSVGGSDNEQSIGELLVKNCTFSGTQNGVRMKTWSPSYPGLIYNVTFDQLIMNDVSNPIVIDQNYCPSRRCGPTRTSKVKIRDIQYRNISGTSKTKVAVNLQCSDLCPCLNVVLSDISLVYSGSDGEATAACSSVKGAAHGVQKPPSCLQSPPNHSSSFS